MNRLETMTAAVVSTAHMTREEDAQLEAGKVPGDTDLASPLSWEFGWMFYIGKRNNNDLTGLSEGFAGAINAAWDAGIEWLRFDVDGPILDGVTTYDW